MSGTALRKSITRQQAPLLLLLAALVLRALVPTGYMLETAAGHLQLRFCEAQAGVHHHQHAGHALPGHDTRAHPGCSYALSAAPALSASPATLAAPSAATAASLPRHYPGAKARFGPPRLESARGPPELI